MNNKNQTHTNLTNEEIDWETIDNIPFSEVCEWLDIPISKNHKIHCPSPYHDDKRPSCSIKNDTYCKCFSCGFTAGPYRLVKTVLKCSKSQAVRFIHKHTPVIIPVKGHLISEIRFQPWELACMGLQKNPLLEQTVKMQTQEDQTTSLSFGLDEISALEIINDKFIENCITEKMFLYRYESYVMSVYHQLASPNNPQNPCNKLWEYPDKEHFQKATEAFDAKRNKTMKEKVGMNFSAINEWFISEKDKQISLIIRRRGKDLYPDLVNKINKVISMLEQNEDYAEETHNDRKVQSTMA